MDIETKKFDKYDIRRLTEDKTQAMNSVTVGITWIDGRAFLKHKKRQSEGIYGVCHYSKGVWAITPTDYKRPTGITSILVSPAENYCSKAYSCLNTSCHLNRFNRAMFLADFKDCGAFSLGLPANFKGIWCNENEWKDFFVRVVIQDPAGGTIEYDQEKAKKLGLED